MEDFEIATLSSVSLKSHLQLERNTDVFLSFVDSVLFFGCVPALAVSFPSNILL